LVPELLLGDRYRIEHVIGNLVSNAIKFSPEESEIDVKLSVEKPAGKIDQQKIFIFFWLSVCM
jgi:signal transduction histidine kinase